ncbi:MAG: AarF/UbiB family protein [Patescibacteria group bacterium]
MNPETFKPASNKMTERQAEEKLDEILSNPEYSFLVTIPKNVEIINEAATAIEALHFVNSKIEERERRTFVLKKIEDVEGVEQGEISFQGFKKVFNRILNNKQSIGEGGDAFVYIAESELTNGTTALCYKFAKQIGKNLGRNSLEQELDLHVDFYKALKNFDSSVKVPEPYYYCEFTSHKMIAMERLKARSVDDLLRGFGSMPAWVTEETVNTFCADIKKSLDYCHAKGLYHRDLHLGNLMFTQSPTPTPILGYIIDFGVSAVGQEGLEPYKSSDSRGTFTYADDYGRIEEVRSSLLRLIAREIS